MGKKKKKIHSIKTKITALTIGIVVCVAALLLVVLISNGRKQIVNVTQNYLLDIAEAYGKELEGQEDKLSDPGYLANLLNGVGLQGISSSYAYLVDAEGTMLYHPTADKIGKSVENSVVKSLVQDLKAGKKVAANVVTYDFKGAVKYASYYVNSTNAYILVISADEAEVLKPIRNMAIQGIIITCIIAVLAIAIGLIYAQRVTGPIKTITGMVNRFADMDFTKDEKEDILSKRNDETGDMSRSIKKMREQMEKMILDIRQRSEELFATSDVLSKDSEETYGMVIQVEKAVSEIAEGATSQAGETQKATESVITIGNMVEETASEAGRLHDNTDVIKNLGSEANSTLADLTEINRKTKEAIEIISRQTNTTNESALKIREATALITSIATETNLLSLNASIEAARAGEQGRGFAVVASQIQKLAEQSNESAKTIEHIVSALINDSEKAVHTMEEVKDVMEEQNTKVDKAGEIFEDVLRGIEVTIKGITTISDYTTKMDTARVNVVDVVQNLTAIAEENAAATEETSASATEVNNIIGNISDKVKDVRSIAENLHDTVEVFKI